MLDFFSPTNSFLSLWEVLFFSSLLFYSFDFFSNLLFCCFFCCCFVWLIFISSFKFVWFFFFTSTAVPVRTPFDWWPCRRADRDIRICHVPPAASEAVSRDCWVRIWGCGGSSDCKGRRWVPRGRASTYHANWPVMTRFRCAFETPFLRRRPPLRPPRRLRLLRRRPRPRRRRRLLLCGCRPPSAAPLETSAIFRIEIPSVNNNNNNKQLASELSRGWSSCQLGRYRTIKLKTCRALM